MSEQGGGGSGWTFLKVLGVIFGLLGMVGFGICSLCGFAFAGHDMAILGLALLGAVLTALCVWLVVAMFRMARRDRDRDRRP
jgi:uncharacterized membrane protein